MINLNWNKKFLDQWMKRNDVEKGNFCLPFVFNDKTNLMNGILFMGLKFDKTKIFKSLYEIETEVGCGVFQIILNGKEKK